MWIFQQYFHKTEKGYVISYEHDQVEVIWKYSQKDDWRLGSKLGNIVTQLRVLEPEYNQLRRNKVLSVDAVADEQKLGEGQINGLMGADWAAWGTGASGQISYPSKQKGIWKNCYVWNIEHKCAIYCCTDCSISMRKCSSCKYKRCSRAAGLMHIHAYSFIVHGKR